MKKKVLWLTETAVLLALLVTLQAVTKAFGQLVTGSCVNALLAVACLFGSLSCGITVAVISPVLAYLLGVAPQILTVPAIMIGNCVYVLCLHFLCRRKPFQRIAGLLAAAAVKFLTLYGIVGGLICGVFAKGLMESGVLKPPMLTALPATFSSTS